MKKIFVFWSKNDYESACTQSTFDWEQADELWIESSDELDSLEYQAYRIFYGVGALECSVCGETFWGPICPYCDEDC